MPIILLLLICMSVASLLLYSTQASNRAEQMTEELLLAAVHEQKTLIAVKMDSERSLLTLLASTTCLCKDPTSIEAQMKLQATVEDSDFRVLLAANREGFGVFSDATARQLTMDEYLAQTLSGAYAFEYAGNTDLTEDGEAFLLAVPISNGEETIGAVVGVLDASILHDMFDENAYNGSETYLIDTQGNIIVGYDRVFQTDDNDNLFSILRAAEMIKPAEAQTVIDDIQSGGTGTIKFATGSNRWYVAYSPSAYEGWYICRSIPAEIVDQKVLREKREGFIAIGIAMLSVLFLTGYIAVLFNRKIKNSRLEREKLMDAEEEYRIATQKRGMMIIRYDIDSGSMISNTKTIEQFHLPDYSIRFDADWVFNELVSAESREAYRSFWLSIRRGEPSGEAEIRMKNANGEYRWYGFDFTLLKEDSDKGTQAIISIRDITAQQERIFAYRRWQNALASSLGFGVALMEVNISTGLCERAEGEFSALLSKNESQPLAERILARFCETLVESSDRAKFTAFVSPERLLESYQRGERSKETEISMLREDGSRRQCIVTAQMTLDPDSAEIKAFLIVKDLDKITRDIDRLSGLALRDELSGLLNRTAARNAIEEALIFGGGGLIALFMIDADNFKQVNDLLGHQNGDLALKQMSDVIRSTFRSTDVIARIGGDEFFVFLSEVPGEEFAEQKAKTLCENLRFNYTVEERGSISMSASIGVIVAARGTCDYDWLYKQADLALYDAKNAGKNRYSIRLSGSPNEALISKSVTPVFAQQLNHLMRQLDGGVVLLETNDTIEPVFISDGLFLKSIYENRQNVEQTFLEATVHPLDIVSVESAIRACTSSGESFQLSFRYLRHGEEQGWLHMNAALAPSVPGGKPAVVAVFSEITDLRETTKHIESLEAVSQIGIFIMRVGERLEITFFNDGALAISGFSFEQMRLFSRDAAAFFRGENLERLRAEIGAAIAENRMVDFVYRSQGFSGKEAHDLRLFGIRLDVQNDIPSYLMIVLERDETD